MKLDIKNTSGENPVSWGQASVRVGRGGGKYRTEQKETRCVHMSFKVVPFFSITM